MGYITKRLYQFRGINRSLQPSAFDMEYAYDAVNVDIVAGKLTNKNIGSMRLVTLNDVPVARPIIFFNNVQNYLILRHKFIALGGGYEKTNPQIGSGYYTLLGDANCDGKVTSADSAAVLRHVQGLSTLDLQGQLNADVNFDGVIDNSDAQLIMQNVVHLIDLNPPWEDPNEHEVGPYEVDRVTKQRTVDNVVNDEALTPLYIKGVGRESLYAKIDNTDVVLVSGMLGETNDSYVKERGFYVDGCCNTGVYYLGTETPSPKVHIRKFGSGQFMLKDREVMEVYSDAETGVITSIVLNSSFSGMTSAEISRAKLDGVFLFDDEIGDEFTEDEIDNAIMWLEVTDVVDNSGDAEFIVNTTHKASELPASSYLAIRGGCSDMPVTFMQMYYGRLFAAAHKDNPEHPRRLYWSCLPGDGRTIEDWTQTEVSVDTSGGHVDIGEPSDECITGLVVSNSQLLIFTKNRLYRLYGTSPSVYRVELVGELESMRVSNAIEVNGTVYWLSLSGVCYYNGSYISTVDDNYSTRNLIESLPHYIKESMMYSTVHASMFDNSIMWSFDSNHGLENECLVIRYEFETGNVIKYIVPCNKYLQQFTDVLKDNFGMNGGSVIKYEIRYLQALVHANDGADDSMTLTQWYGWGRQPYGWYDGQPVESSWDSGWTDMQSPESVKKLQDISVRGEGHFDLTIESEINTNKLQVTMPDSHNKVRDLTPHATEGRMFHMRIDAKEPFEIEPYMTMKFETGMKR